MLAASLLFLALGGAHGADDRFDRSKFGGLGGFRPVENDVYRRECGTCHFAYLPGLLPARSWLRVLDQSAEHFGESLGIAPERAVQLRDYLLANAADRVPDKGSAVLLERLNPDAAPLRVTALPLIYRNHVIVREIIRINTAVRARTLTNCDACHRQAAQGSFALEDLIVPGLTKTARPGGGF